MPMLRWFTTGLEMVSSSGGSLWSRTAQAVWLPPRSGVPLCNATFPSTLPGLDRRLGTPWHSFHLQCKFLALKHVRPRETLIFYELERREVLALTCRWHAQDAECGWEMSYFIFFLFFFFPLSFFPLPATLQWAAPLGTCQHSSSSYIRTAFFSWNLGPLLMCDLQR